MDRNCVAISISSDKVPMVEVQSDLRPAKCQAMKTLCQYHSHQAIAVAGFSHYSGKPWKAQIALATTRKSQ